MSMTPTLDTLGARLAVVRQHHGLNMKDAARICDIPAATWREWELGGRQPRDYLTECGRIAQRLEVDLHWLVFGPGVIAAHDPLAAVEADPPLSPAASVHSRRAGDIVAHHAARVAS